MTENLPVWIIEYQEGCVNVLKEVGELLSFWLPITIHTSVCIVGIAVTIGFLAFAYEEIKDKIKSRKKK